MMKRWTWKNMEQGLDIGSPLALPTYLHYYRKPDSHDRLTLLIELKKSSIRVEVGQIKACIPSHFMAYCQSFMVC
jgi:hypothetical protein